jgi:hypothetical protein
VGVLFSLETNMKYLKLSKVSRARIKVENEKHEVESVMQDRLGIFL